MKRSDALALHRRALNHDPTAMQEFIDLWDGRGELLCFICDRLVAPPPFTAILPEYGTTENVLCVPLCMTCRALPEMMRIGRSLRILKRMYSLRSKKNITFRFGR
jgi:hypothetical protein